MKLCRWCLRPLANGADLHPECEAGWSRLVPPPDLERLDAVPRRRRKAARTARTWNGQVIDPAVAAERAKWGAKMSALKRQARARAAADRAP